MAESPLLALTEPFTFRKTSSIFKVKFFERFLIISDVKDTQFKESIKYSEIYKLKSTSESLKIVLKDRNTITIPCTIAEIKKVQQIFTKGSINIGIKCIASALVEFGDKCFIVTLNSTNFADLQSIILRRIARFFFPAYGTESILLENHETFAFHVRCRKRLVVLDSTDDLEAALRYCKNRLHIIILGPDKR